MKLLHTSDLHLGQTWRGLSRRDDQQRILDEILGLADEHDVDLILVAGDVFHDHLQGETHARLARWLLERLRPHLERGRAVLLLRGNHDPLELFRLMHALSAELGNPGGWPLLTIAEPGVFRIPTRPGRGLPPALQVIALPYLTPRWLRDRLPDSLAVPGEAMAQASGLLRLNVRMLSEAPELDPALPTIFTTHLLVQGAGLVKDHEDEIGYDRELTLDVPSLPHFTRYNALGHIHLKQELRSAVVPTHYCGAPDRTNLGERSYEPAVALAEWPDHGGGPATVRELPLAGCTPLVDERLAGFPEVEAFCARRWPVSPLGQVLVSGIEPADRASVEGQLQAAAPRVEVRWELPRPEAGAAPAPQDEADIPRAVSEYLEQAISADPERHARLQAAFDALWSEVPA